jgi:polygalacturonase
LVFLVLVLATASQAVVRDVKNYGAVGNGVTSDTVAINNTVAACDPNDVVYFPTGTFKSGSIVLKSNIALELSSGATLLATNAAEYSPVEYNIWGDLYGYQDWGHSHWESSLIWGIGLENITITGTGLINGEAMTAGDPADYHGDRAISFKGCSGILIENIKIYHAGHFGIIVTGCSGVTIDNVLIDTNRDGMNIDCSDDVEITGCVVNAPGDDAICMKSSYALGYKRATEDVVIDNCTVTGYRVGDVINNIVPRHNDPSGLKTGRIKFGTESNGGFKNITITNCDFESCNGFMLATVDGGDIDNINISDITMVDLTCEPIFLRLGNRGRGPGPPPPGTYRNLTMTNITANTVYGGASCIASGIPGHMIEDIVFDNVTVHSDGGGTSAMADIVLGENEEGYPEAFMFGTLTPSYAFYLRHVDGVEFHDCDFDFNYDDERPSFILVDANSVELDNTDAERSASNDKFMAFYEDVDNLNVHDCVDFPVVTASYGQVNTSKAKVRVGEPFTISIDAETASDGIISTGMYVDSQIYDTEYLWLNGGDTDANDIKFEDVQLYTPGEIQIDVGGSSLVQGVCLWSDFDFSYVTDLEDMMVMAEDWLDDATVIVMGSDPVAWWYFYEGSGTVANDSSGYNNTGTIYGGATWVVGKYDNAIEFDGVNDYVGVLDSSSISVGRGDYTISAWVYPHTVSGKHGIVTKVKDSAQKEYAFSIENGALTLEVEVSGNNGREATGPVVVTNVWQYVMVVFDSTTTNAKFYVDNQLQEVISDSITALPISLDDRLCIGRWGGTYNNSYFDGVIDGVRIYNYAMEPKEASVADINGDRKVTLADFAVFANEWLEDVRD